MQHKHLNGRSDHSWLKLNWGLTKLSRTDLSSVEDLTQFRRKEPYHKMKDIIFSNQDFPVHYIIDDLVLEIEYLFLPIVA